MTPYNLSEIARGEKGTDQTVSKIREFTTWAVKNSPEIRSQALEALRMYGVVSGDDLGAARAIYDWILDNIQFIKDPVDLELVQAPDITLRTGSGDCDDQAALVAAMAESIGLPARFVVAGYDRNQFEHIYPEILVRGRWIALDTARPDPSFNRRPDLPVKKVYNKNGVQNMLGQDKVLPVTREQLSSRIRSAVTRTLSNNWSEGLIDLSDLNQYLDLIRNKNAPFSGQYIIEGAVTKAIQDFKNKVLSLGMPSYKSAGAYTPLSGLFSSIWDSVKNTIGSVADVWATGGSIDFQKPDIIYNPDMTSSGSWNIPVKIEPGDTTKYILIGGAIAIAAAILIPKLIRR